MKRILAFVVVAMMVSLVAVPALAADPGKPHGMMAKLGLTPDQMKKVEAMKADMAAKMLPLKAQKMVKKAELRLLWTADSPDKGKIMAKQAELNALKEKMFEAKVDHKLAMLKLLNPEQRVKFLMHAGKHHKRHEGMGKGGCGCMGGHEGGECPMHEAMEHAHAK